MGSCGFLWVPHHWGHRGEGGRAPLGAGGAPCCQHPLGALGGEGKQR